MARAAVGWGVRELAEKAGVTANTVTRIENGADAKQSTMDPHYNGHLRQPASSLQMANSPACASPRPPQRNPRNPPARQIQHLPRKQPAARPPRRPRRSDSCGAECAREDVDGGVKADLKSERGVHAVVRSAWTSKQATNE